METTYTTTYTSDPGGWVSWKGDVPYIEPWPLTTPRDALYAAIVGYLVDNQYNIDLLVSDMLKMADEVCKAHGK